jgi:hypothetical protein
LTNLKRYSEDLNKYIYLMGLQVQSADLIIFLFSPSRSIIQLL